MYINWKLDPFAVGTNTYLANSGVINAYAFPSFLSDTDMHSESSERVGGDWLLVIGKHNLIFKCY